MESDFLRFYNLDLNYIHENDLITWRRFLVLVRGLSSDSAFIRWYENKDNRKFIESEEVDISK